MSKRQITVSILTFACLMHLSGANATTEWRDTDKYKRVFLGGFPRSGNHWMRYSFEEITGIATGSVYRDPEPTPHLYAAFDWGGYTCPGGYEAIRKMPEPGDTVIIKTHYPWPSEQYNKDDNLVYDRFSDQKMVALIHLPMDSIASNFFYNNPDNYKKFNWRKFVRRWAKKWKEHTDYWEKQSNVLLVRYEDLMEDPGYWLRNICDYLGIDATDKDISRSLERYPPIGAIGKHLKRYSAKDIKDVCDIIGRPLLNKYGYLELLGKD